VAQPAALPSELTFTVQPLSNGYPALVDSNFTAAIASSEAGGDSTQSFFDALNRTSDFWTLVANKTITFAPGVDPHGRPVIMAGSGNVELRAEVVPAATDSSVDAVLTITTRNTTTMVAQMVSFGLVASSTIQPEDVETLAPAIYESVQALLTGLAGQLAGESQVESPEIDASRVVGAVVADVSSMAIRAAGNTLLHIDWMAVQWSAEIVSSLSFLSVLVAIPLIIEFTGHTMAHSLIVQNLTDADFTCTPTLEAGQYSVKPSSSTVPAKSTQADPLDSSQSDTFSYAVAMQTGSTEFGSIGFVVDLASAGGDKAQLLVSIPWSGGNTIWAGSSAGSADDAWAAHSLPASRSMTTSATFGSYKVTLSINALSGETYGSYFYCSTAVIEPA
jgi:hypothetical protein